MSVITENPLLSGFYPDPSACVVNDDIYIVNSSFAYFPGLPVMHSKDLAHWEQIGNVMDRESQLPLEGAPHSNGLFAPTIRYNDGTFYVICTNVSFGGNYIVTAEDPEGPWSEPHYIDGADGIDPSLFFDTDGKCYYIGTHPNPDGCRYDGDWFIYIQEIDIESFKLIGEPKNVWNGAMRGVHWPEGPHLYKINDYYYIIHAEGGTGPEHAISVARSKDVFGPYENNFCNPIFTHRHLGKRYPIKYVGHGDLFQTVNGEWYMVMLAVRPTNEFTTMGRETFLARVIWENDWPVVNAGLGILSEQLKVNLDEYEVVEPVTSLPNVNKDYDFKKMSMFGPEWMALRKSYERFATFEKGEGLFLEAGTDNLTELATPSYVCIRQDSHCFEAKATFLTDNLYMGVRAGLAYVQNDKYQLRFEISECIGQVILVKNGVEEVWAEEKITDSPASIILKVDGVKASCFVVTKHGVDPVIRNLDISDLSTEVAGGFVGCTVGIFATDGVDRDEAVKVQFTEFNYHRIKAAAEEK
ncbi:MAG: glycoside hydrolase family 43 protein [Lachnospiraceae bacterium]|nr:glycoside hydrolase family 43 protein [Lachnospiraceae bacterium]